MVAHASARRGNSYGWPPQSWTRRVRVAKAARECSEFRNGDDGLHRVLLGEVVEGTRKQSRTLLRSAEPCRGGCRGLERVGSASLRPRASAALSGMKGKSYTELSGIENARAELLLCCKGCSYKKYIVRSVTLCTSWCAFKGLRWCQGAAIAQAAACVRRIFRVLLRSVQSSRWVAGVCASVAIAMVLRPRSFCVRCC